MQQRGIRGEKSDNLFLHIRFADRPTRMCDMSGSLADSIRKSDRLEGK